MSWFHGIVKWIVVSGTCIFAASGQTLVDVAIPFPFHIGENEYPSGEYRVKASYSPSMILLRSSDGSYSHFVLTQPMEKGPGAAPEQPRVVFQRYGSTYFLSTVWLPDSRSGMQVVPNRRQQELARKHGPAQSEILIGSIAPKTKP